ncbi:MAG: biotin transport system substrate-specific component [Thermoplasmata archaeon]|jgi:biotin transporter BioY|nr:biotin transport system substrate-specific component [Thermoplasmata archaeon]
MAAVHAFAQRTVAAWGTPTKVLVAAGFAGVLGLLSQVSVPVPWTPVPLTLQLFGVLLVATCLGTRYGLLSIGMYLAAGALGLHAFAPSSDGFNSAGIVGTERWRVLVPDLARHTGFTAGYLFGFGPASLFVATYLRRRESGLGDAWVRRAALLLIVLLASASAAVFFLAGGNTFAGEGAGSAYASSLDALWVFAAVAVVAVPCTAWWLLRRRGGPEALNLYVVLLGAVAIIHLCGVLVLGPTLGLTWTKAVALGSTVFLPFDALKAGAAVALALPFLPSRHPTLETNA